jgi:hypothetical protein
MYLVSARLVNVGPFADLTFPFRAVDGSARRMTVVHGSGGVGKTALLTALAHTRPGFAGVFTRPSAGSGPAFAVCEYVLSADDPERPHPLAVATPGIRLEQDDALVRKELAHFEARARAGGFVFVSFPAARWFSRQPIAIHAPLAGVARYDVKASAALDDSTRFDLSRDTKQALAYAEIVGALAGGAPVAGPPGMGPIACPALGDAMRTVVDRLVDLEGHAYVGLEPRSLEPVFVAQGGRRTTFDGLPTRARHLVAFGALTVRALWAAYPTLDPRGCEAIVAIDEVDLHQSPAVAQQLPSLLRHLLPQVQWILTTTSAAVASACDRDELLTLRRTIEDADGVELHVDSAAVTH